MELNALGSRLDLMNLFWVSAACHPAPGHGYPAGVCAGLLVTWFFLCLAFETMLGLRTAESGWKWELGEFPPAGFKHSPES